MRRLSFWLAVGGVSIISTQIVWPVIVNKVPSPGLRALSAYKNGS